MRTSSKGTQPLKWSEHQTYTYNGTTNVVSDYSGTDSNRPFELSRSDVQKSPVIDGFRQATPYRSDLTSTEPYFYVAVWKRSGQNGYDTTVSDQIPLKRWPVPPLPREDDGVKSMLKSRCLDKAKSETINLAVTLAQLGQTIDLVADNSKRLLAAISAARRMDAKALAEALGVPVRPRTKKSKAVKTAKGVSSLWLEYIYGWLPLMSDIHGAIEAVDAGILREGFRLKVTSRHTRDARQTLSLGHYRVGIGGTLTITNSYEIAWEQKMSMYFDVDMPRLQKAASLGLTNPGLVAWELVPFSFVLDWFIPVGDWLSSIDSTVGLNFRGGSHTFYARMGLTAQKGKYGRSPPGSFTDSPGSYERVVSNRTLVDDRLSPFYLKNPFSTARAVTSVALITQFAKAKR